MVYGSAVLLFYTVLAFLLGSLPFSVWIGRAATGKDIRQVGDHNPGATNVLRAGSSAGFILAMIIDITKGALPVGLAYQQWGIQDWRIVPIALAPVAGHAFSPFLRGKGGKALATALGVWIGLTIWTLSLAALGFLVLWRLIVRPSAWALLLALICLGLVIAIWFPDPIYFAVLAGQAAILLYKHGSEFQERPSLRRRNT
ncbi:MAG: glycerol-3-phosphate acyltransferase [Candidatus Promineifilaceae bacterium]|jgi:acyl phosphate:glycerol-3-phosphate acyltransferase